MRTLGASVGTGAGPARQNGENGTQGVAVKCVARVPLWVLPKMVKLRGRTRLTEMYKSWATRQNTGEFNSSSAWATRLDANSVFVAAPLCASPFLLPLSSDRAASLARPARLCQPGSPGLYAAHHFSDNQKVCQFKGDGHMRTECGVTKCDARDGGVTVSHQHASRSDEGTLCAGRGCLRRRSTGHAAAPLIIFGQHCDCCLCFRFPCFMARVLVTSL